MSRRFHVAGLTLLLGCVMTARAAAGDPYVLKVQQSLSQLGYDAGPPDGFVGPRTQAAILAFQASVGLQTTGKDSSKLRDYLYVYTLPIIRTDKAPRSTADFCGYSFNFNDDSQSIDLGDAPESCIRGVRKRIAEDLPNMPFYSLVTSKAGWREWDRKLSLPGF